MASVKIPTIIWFLLISILAFSIYLLTKGPPPGQDHYVWLASAFLHGKLGISNSGLEELVNWHGNYYVVYPPGPAVLLMPFVAVFGTSFDESLLSIILASISVSVTWLMLRKVGANKNKALWLTVLFGFGTCLWFIASVGSSWYIAEVVAVLFLTSAIVLTLYQKSYALIGLLLGLATLARLTVVLAFPFFLFIVYERNSTLKPRFKQAAVFLIALAIPLILYVAYNMVRYGTVLDIGYNIIIKNDPNYPYGLYSIYYLPKHIYAIFFQGPILQSSFPYFKPNWMGLGLFFTTPAFIYIFKGPWNRLSKYAIIAILCILPSLVFHGTVGFTQFGYRFSLDFTPFLMLLTANGMGENLGWKARALIILSVIVNLWGTISIIKFNFVSF